MLSSEVEGRINSRGPEKEGMSLRLCIHRDTPLPIPTLQHLISKSQWWNLTRNHHSYSFKLTNYPSFWLHKYRKIEKNQFQSLENKENFKITLLFINDCIYTPSWSVVHSTLQGSAVCLYLWFRVWLGKSALLAQVSKHYRQRMWGGWLTFCTQHPEVKKGKKEIDPWQQSWVWL